MPLYEGRHNAVNKIKISDQVKDKIITEPEDVYSSILSVIESTKKKSKATVNIAFDGWYGVDWEGFISELEKRSGSSKIAFINFNSVLSSQQGIEKYKAKYIGEDPSFGFANLEGKINDIVDGDKLNELRSSLVSGIGSDVTIVYNSGSFIPELYDIFDLRFYFDFTRQPLLWKMWDGKLIPFGSDNPGKDYSWKEYYYCDFYLLENQKHFAFTKMDYYVEAIDLKEIKLIPRNAYDEIMQILVNYPVKEVEIYQPGPWGAYRYKDFWDIEGLECNAWNELAGPELSILVQVAEGKIINMPFMNLIQYQDKLLGTYLAKEYPGLFPMDVWLDDGYFPEPNPAERISMPIHNHPGTDYVKRHFNEPLGRYETYYIAEAYENANTWMGFLDSCDTEEWEMKCRESWDSMKPIPDWKNYIKRWKTNVGDLFLIPPGTTHGHGGNQMVLEMDTCPSIAGTEYSFFMYDFMRPSWDDQTKTMTGKPVKMHLDHGFNMDQMRREDWVEKHLRAKPEIIRWERDFFIDRYSSYGPMPFEIERIHFYKKAEYSTEGRICHISTLTVGENVIIRSISHPEFQTDINLFQSAVIPACFSDYEIVNSKTGFCVVVLIRWKKG